MFSTAFMLSLSLSTLAFTASPPSLHIPLALQLVPSNPAVSSMYSINPTSALLFNTSRSSLALRVPPKWSFSIGLEWDTFLTAPDDSDGFLSYSATLENGSDLPEWMFFDPDTYVFGGFTPEEPQSLSIVVTASTSSHLTASDSFIFIISSYDLYVYGPLLTRNVTAGQFFSILLNDFQGVHLTAGADIFQHRKKKLSFDIELAVDTTALSWLSYNPKSRVLQGTAPNVSTSEDSVIGATITVYHQGRTLSVSSNFTLSVIPPAFSDLVLPPILIYPGKVLSFSLLHYLSSVSAWTISATISEDARWLSFDPVHLSLNGSVPVNASGNIQVTFMAKDVDRGLHSSTQLALQVVQHTNTSHTIARNRKELLIVLGTILGIVVFIVIVFTIVIINYRRRLRLSTSTLPSKSPPLARRQSFIHRFQASLVKHVLPYKETARAVAKKAMPEFAFFRQLLSRSAPDSSLSPTILKSRIGDPIAALEGSTGLLAGLVDAKRTEDLVPIRAGDMKQSLSRHNRKRSLNVVYTPISMLSHIAVKGSLEGMDSMDSMECAVIEGESDGGETLADRKALLLKKKKHVTKIALSPSGRATVTVAPPAVDKSLPPTPGSTERPSAPTPIKATQFLPMSSLNSDPSATCACAVQSRLESVELTAVVSPLSNLKCRPLPIPKPTFRRHKSLRPTPMVAASSYDQACKTSSLFRPVDPMVDILSLLPTLSNVPISSFSEPCTPPPSIPLPVPPTTPVSTKRRVPFGESSQESITSLVDEDTLPRLLSPLMSRIHKRTRSCTTHDGLLMTPRAARERARLETQLELTMDNFRLDEFSEGVFSEVGIKEEGIDGELVSREPSPLSEDYSGPMESDHGPVPSASSTALSNRVCLVSYPPDTPFQFKVPLRGVAPDDELLVLCAYGSYNQPPPWACFEGASGTFRGVTPKLKSGKRLRVKLNVWNLATGDVAGTCEIRVTHALEQMLVIGHAC